MSDSASVQEQHLSKVLGPMHIWALGVGIVLVGEFMGWNFTVAKGGSLGAIIACWIIGILYISLVMINTEIGSVIPEAGGQYAMAKYLLGPLAAFNIGLMLVFEYVMLEAADALVVGAILESINPEIQSLPFVILTLLLLTYLNYRGVYATLTLNFFITAIAFVTIFVLLFSTKFYIPSQTILHLSQLTNGLPYGWIGVLAALQFGIWFYLGIEGTALAAEECRSTARSLPMGTLIGMVTLLVGATVTWFVCSGLVEAGSLGESVYPLYEAALSTNMSGVIVVMFIGTILACMASANGCINDASRAWFSMSRDTLIPDAFSAVHPRYKTPYRAILFLLPISLAFGYTGLLDQVITFSILSALLVYLFMGYMMFKFRKMYPMGSIERGYVAPWHPIPAVILVILTLATLGGMYFGYWVNVLAGLLFYFLASLWFTLHRYKFVDTKAFLQAGANRWPRPHGY
ncbi:amino acid transporter [Desulfosporosinus orientis DSM 765]|uniref:Amino acid transporter n=1 Tax=Desulfosporosinus orientis (strain ATCC 19365 / DSM 765 / NCIMB 8382 / VKM B-1628 / Singapore I) TaxID=768706 RepID=G7WET4_DESOD|nr:amino acid permease [Desulfosporosinus orientis]AET67263.1 amino acid transporter [Desulfosporosinus orientis DSM 765]